MSAAPVVVVGAGGHASVVIDALLSADREVLGATDLDPALHGAQCAGVPIIGDDGALERFRPEEIEVAVGVGAPGGVGLAARRAVSRRLSEAGFRLATVVHPSATVSRLARIEPGAQVMARAVLQPGACVGTGAIVNTGAILEHGVVLGEFAHVAPGAVIAADATIEEGVFIGAGAVVRQGSRVVTGVVIGAGAAVVADVTTPGVHVGVPCRLTAPTTSTPPGPEGDLLP